jgi:hypothetical protein
MWKPIAAAEHPACSMLRALACRVRSRRLRRFHDEIQRYAQAATKLAVSAGVRTEFVMPEIERKPGFVDFDAAEFDAPDRMPLTNR